MSKYRSYADYEQSAINWIDALPKHWTRSKLGFESSVKARLGWRGLKAEEYVEDGYIFLSTPNIKGRHIDFDNVNYISQDRFVESPEIILEAGDVLVAKDGSTTGTSNVVRQLPAPSTVNSSIAVIRPKTSLHSLYLYYFFLSNYVQHVIKMMQGGMGVPHLFQADLRWFDLILPPMEEQLAIAKFLDRETARIDALIEKKRRLIELLKEKRQAVVTQAVTKGLDPNVPMKDSSVEWLGEVPAHWDVVMLGKKIQLQRGVDITKDQQEDGPYPVVSSGGIDSYHSEYITSGPGVVVGRKGTAGKVHYVKGNYWPHDTTLYVRRFGGNLPRFVYYKLLAMDLASYDTGSANPTVNRNVVHPTRVSWPPILEQSKISAYLDIETVRIDDLCGKTTQSIDLLKEHRSALITAAVTGQIDVRDAA